MIRLLTTQKEQDKLCKSFKKFDTKNLGDIDQNSFISAYLRIYNDMDKSKVIAKAKKIFHEIDLNNSGKIEYSEWQIVTIDREQLLSD